MGSGNAMQKPKGKHLDDEVLSSYIDGTLSARERAAVERHLATCPHCMRNMKTLQQTVQLLQQLPQLAVPRVFTLQQAGVAPQPARRNFAFAFLRAATAVVAVLLAVVIAGDLLIRQAIPSPYVIQDWTAGRESVPATEMVTMKISEPTRVAEALPAKATPTPEPLELTMKAFTATPKPVREKIAPTTPVPAPKQAVPTETLEPKPEIAPMQISGLTVSEATETPTEISERSPEERMAPSTESLGGTEMGGIGAGVPAQEETGTPSMAIVAVEAQATSTPEATPTPAITQPAATAVAEQFIGAVPTPTAVERVEMPAKPKGEAFPLLPESTIISTFRLVEIALLLIVVALAGATIVSRPRR